MKKITGISENDQNTSFHTGDRTGQAEYILEVHVKTVLGDELFREVVTLSKEELAALSEVVSCYIKNER